MFYWNWSFGLIVLGWIWIVLWVLWDFRWDNCFWIIKKWNCVNIFVYVCWIKLYLFVYPLLISPLNLFRIRFTSKSKIKIHTLIKIISYNRNYVILFPRTRASNSLKICMNYLKSKSCTWLNIQNQFILKQKIINENIYSHTHKNWIKYFFFMFE